ncbi:hypothetical protein LguiB_009599 [Lonicera macranthoides]
MLADIQTTQPSSSGPKSNDNPSGELALVEPHRLGTDHKSVACYRQASLILRTVRQLQR